MHGQLMCGLGLASLWARFTRYSETIRQFSFGCMKNIPHNAEQYGVAPGQRWDLNSFEQRQRCGRETHPSLLTESRCPNGFSSLFFHWPQLSGFCVDFAHGNISPRDRAIGAGMTFAERPTDARNAGRSPTNGKQFQTERTALNRIFRPESQRNHRKSQESRHQ